MLLHTRNLRLRLHLVGELGTHEKKTEVSAARSSTAAIGWRTLGTVTPLSSIEQKVHLFIFIYLFSRHTRPTKKTGNCPLFVPFSFPPSRPNTPRQLKKIWSNGRRVKKSSFHHPNILLNMVFFSFLIDPGQSTNIHALPALLLAQAPPSCWLNELAR